jgi:MoaA/NifB/PqqE/SkfB family radical SAM enzyme
MRKLTFLSKLSSLRQTIVVGALLAPFIDHDNKFVPYPYTMTLVVTRRCNGRCQMCSIWRDKTSASLSLEQIEHIFSRSDFSFVRSMTLTGGEPTLRADLPQLFEILIERLRGLEHVLLAVNGLDPPRTVEHISQMLEILDASDNRVRSFDVQISFDGIGWVHDVVRGIPGSFQNVKATLDQLSALQARFPRLNLWLHCTLMPHNLPYVDPLRHFVKQHSLQITYGVVAFSREYYDNLHQIA